MEAYDSLLDKQFFKKINEDNQYCKLQRRKYDVVSNIFAQEILDLMHCAK